MMLPAGYQMRLGTPADFAAVRAFYNQLIDDMEHLPHHPMWDKEGHPSDAYLRSYPALNHCYETPPLQILPGWGHTVLGGHEPTVSPFAWQSNKTFLFVVV